MSDSDELGIIYTEVSSPLEDLSDIGSPRADDHEYLELPEMLEDPYVEAALQDHPLQITCLALRSQSRHHLRQIIFQAQSILMMRLLQRISQPEADPEEDDDEDPEEDPVDYSADGGDDKDDEDEPSKEDKDDDVDMEANGDEEKEEHLAPADSVRCTLTSYCSGPSAEETEPVLDWMELWAYHTHLAYRSDAEVARLLAISTPPSSPLSPWSSPLPRIPSPSLPLSPP
ncbi:hypothetical protein Tco_0285274 [Tanacetum coccineum]